MGRRSRIAAGMPYPLGATWDGLGVNLALFSANATRVELCLFDRQSAAEQERVALPEQTDGVWHGYLPDARPGLAYGYRVHGPYAPEAGHRFNPSKLLLDPYAKGYAGTLRRGPALFGYRQGEAGRGGDLQPDERDSAPLMPKCVVIDPASTWTRGGGRRRSGAAALWDRTIVYEMHVRGYTKRHPAVPEQLRGTFGGLAVREVVEHIRSLGVTSVELLPVHACADEEAVVRRGLSNYWGYSTAGFFAPDPRLASDPAQAHAEFRTMVAHLHDAGIEVVLDVVYNHTAEGDETGPTLSFRGIDNASYYRLLPEDRRRYVNHTGCGNTLDLSHPRVLQMVMDSLRYWVEEMGVDGFRFDLAATLAREQDGFDEGSGFLDACRQDPVLSTVKLIAEPWDLGPGGYQVGRFPAGWGEWNDKFRDDVRAFWRGDDGASPRLAARLCGSADLFEGRGRKPWASVNFVTAHDGFTLRDLVSYERKHNQANGEGNRDGNSHNLSANHGVEGETGNPAVNAVRRRQMRNMLATLLLAQGTPMLLAGDEFGRTQRGNNNPYCQDNEISWLDWTLPDWAEAQMRFVRKLTRLRHAYAMFRRTRYLVGEPSAALGVKDVTWINANGKEMRPEEWGDAAMRCFGMLVSDDRARHEPVGTNPGTDAPSMLEPADEIAAALIVFNAHYDQVGFTLPDCTDDEEWKLVLDTNVPDREDGQRYAAGDPYAVTQRSLLLFMLHDRPGSGGRR